jgi:hypothetical protein
MLKILSQVILLLVGGTVLTACSTTDENLRHSSIPLLDAPDWGWLESKARCENIEMNLVTDCPPWDVCVIEERYSVWCTP